MIVTAFNEQDYIEDCLESIYSQTYSNFECIVVDDCSTDRTTEIVKKVIKKDERFKLISHKVNSGLPASRNTGMLAATGKYITFLDGDDFFFQDSLRLRRDSLVKSENDPNCIGVYSGWFPFYPDENPFGKNSWKDGRHERKSFLSTGLECPFIATAPMLKRDMFLKFGGFDESLKQAEDWDMWSRILREGFTLSPVSSKQWLIGKRRFDD